jgi:prevent-host-death family protein
MRVMTATELRARLGEALNRASAGERILIERDHRPLAVLVTPEDAARLEESAEERARRMARALERLAAFSERMARVESSTERDSAALVREDRDSGHGDHG